MRRRSGEKRDNWLLIKSDDEHADRKRDILEDAPQSVKSGLTVDEVGDDPDARHWQSNRKAKSAAAEKPKTATPPRPRAAQAGPGEAKLPPFIPPCLARLEKQPPAGDEWLHEVKFDGYRIAGACRRRRGQALHPHRPRLDAIASAATSLRRLPAST